MARISALKPPPTLEESAYQEIRTALARGAFHPGERVSISDLGMQLGVSRMPVIHALRRLASEGFVVIHPHKTVTVADPTPDEIRERYLIVGALERLAVAEAWPHLTPVVRARVAELHERIVRDRAPPDLQDRLDAEFHAILWECSQLPQLLGKIRRLWDQGAYYRVLLFGRDDFTEERVREHSAIVDALREDNLEHLQEAIALHRERGMRRMVEIVTGRGSG